MWFYLVRNTENVLTKRSQETDTIAKTKHYYISTEICPRHDLKKEEVEMTKNDTSAEEG